jgi:hypothetical protein
VGNSIDVKKLAARLRRASPEALREIALAETGGGDVLSVYLNLDPTEFATAPARETAVRSLLDTVDRVAGDEHSADAEAVREWMTAGDFPPTGALGLAAFIRSDGGYFEAVSLPHAVVSTAIVDQGAALSPIADLILLERWCLLLADRERARLLLGTSLEMEEVSQVADEVHRRHDQGGWSQARYQRGVEQEVDWHLDNVAAAVARVHESRGFDLLALASTSELAPRVLDALPRPIRDQFQGRFDVDVGNAGVAEILAAAEVLFAQREAQRLADALGRVAEGLSTGLAAAGPADVARALEARSVRVLLLDPRSTDGADRAIRQALAQSAEVLVAPAEELERYGRIAAVLRF